LISKEKGKEKRKKEKKEKKKENQTHPLISREQSP